MAIWSRLKTELDRAGRAAQQALDEGKIRLDMHRARAAADTCAQRLGYAVFHARQAGSDLAPDEYQRLSSDLVTAEAEVERQRTLLDLAVERRRGAASDSASGEPRREAAPPPPPPPRPPRPPEPPAEPQPPA